MEDRRFSLVLKKQPVILVGEDGQEGTYVLWELTGAQRNKHLTSLTGRIRVGENGRPNVMKNFNQLHSGLVAMSLKDPNGKPVSQKVLEGYPAETLESLFDMVQEMSGLVEEDEDEVEGND